MRHLEGDSLLQEVGTSKTLKTLMRDYSLLGLLRIEVVLSFQR
jgi:hypothetical protein